MQLVISLKTKQDNNETNEVASLWFQYNEKT